LTVLELENPALALEFGDAVGIAAGDGTFLAV